MAKPSILFAGGSLNSLACRHQAYQADSSLRTISAPALRACSLPRATARGKGAKRGLRVGADLLQRLDRVEEPRDAFVVVRRMQSAAAQGGAL